MGIPHPNRALYDVTFPADSALCDGTKGPSRQKSVPPKECEMSMLHPDSALRDVTLLADCALYDGTKRVGVNCPFDVKLCAGRAFQYTQLFSLPKGPSRLKVSREIGNSLQKSHTI